MRRSARPDVSIRPAGIRLLACALLAALAAPGCGHEEKTEYSSVAKPPTVQVIQPEIRTIVREVGQPSFIEAYERTAVYPKMTAYIEKWLVDIGDKVRKDDVLATLFVPELNEDYQTKNATVKLDEERVKLADQVVEVAEADVKSAEARLEEAKEILAKYQAEVERWDTEVKRLKREVERGVVDPQILLESTNQWKSSVASRDAARATIKKAEAELLSARETLAKDKVDVSVAKADLAVATSEWKRTGALVGYLTLRAPFDGVIFERNANTFDFVLPATGDPTANRRAPDISSASAAPIYVVDRTDVVRIFIDIPERDANYVHGVDLRLIPSTADPGALPTEGRDLVVLARVHGAIHFRFFGDDGKRLVDTDEGRLADSKPQLAGLKSFLAGLWDRPRPRPTGPDKGGVWDKIPGGAPEISPIDKDKVLTALRAIFGPALVPAGTRATVLARGYRDQPIEGTVTRTSWALNITSRTLRAEIDLPNPGSQLLPGMYAYANVIIEHPRVQTLPEAALAHVGDKTYCWLYKDGRARRTEVRTGLSDGDWIEITSIEHPKASKLDHPWTPVRGEEKVILGDLSILADGAPVEVSSAAEGAKLTSDTPENHSANNDSEAIEAGAGTSPQVAAAKAPRAVGQGPRTPRRTPIEGSPPPTKKPILDQRYPKPEDRLRR
jgi:multidrug efflux pump subunit AcrA (membrane-fusion protein)